MFFFAFSLLFQSFQFFFLFLCFQCLAFFDNSVFFFSCVFSVYRLSGNVFELDLCCSLFDD